MMRSVAMETDTLPPSRARRQSSVVITDQCHQGLVRLVTSFSAIFLKCFIALIEKPKNSMWYLLQIAVRQWLPTWNRRLLRDHAPHIRAHAIQRATCALWSLGVANLPPMCNQIDVQWIHPFRRRHFRKKHMSLVGSYLWSDQSQTLRGAVNMRINWHACSV